jgi:hypothetical protein
MERFLQAAGTGQQGMASQVVHPEWSWGYLGTDSVAVFEVRLREVHCLS